MCNFIYNVKMYKYVYTFIINKTSYGILKYSLQHLQKASSLLWNKVHNSPAGKGVNVYIMYGKCHSTFAYKTNKLLIFLVFFVVFCLSSSCVLGAQ